jgi:hypothetical protein
MLVVGVVSLFLQTPTNAAVVATCGASIGKALWADRHAEWKDDGIRSGTFTFTLDEKNEANVLFRDVRGRVVDSAADGGVVALLAMQRQTRGYLFIVVYGDEAIVETYNIFTTGDGTRHLFWTNNRSSNSGTAKVAAFSADCS